MPINTTAAAIKANKYLLLLLVVIIVLELELDWEKHASVAASASALTSAAVVVEVVVAVATWHFFFELFAGSFEKSKFPAEGLLKTPLKIAFSLQ